MEAGKKTEKKTLTLNELQKTKLQLLDLRVRYARDKITELQREQAKLESDYLSYVQIVVGEPVKSTDEVRWDATLGIMEITYLIEEPIKTDETKETPK